MEKVFKPSDLRQFNGKNGRPAYIACEGIVYDVGALLSWEDGSHMGLHDAGVDLTEEMLGAPHSVEMLERAAIVGRLLEE